MRRHLVFAVCLTLIGCSGASVSAIDDSTTTQESNATDPTPSGSDSGGDPGMEKNDASVPAPGPGDAGSKGSLDASTPPADAGAQLCAVNAAASKAYGQCAARTATSVVGVELSEPMVATRPLLLDAAVCGHLAKGGKDAFIMTVKKGDCMEVNFHAKGASINVTGAGISVVAMGDDVSQVRATVAGTLAITVSTNAGDDYALLAR